MAVAFRVWPFPETRTIPLDCAGLEREIATLGKQKDASSDLVVATGSAVGG